MDEIPVRILLFLGLVLHKAVWEKLKRQGTRQAASAPKAGLPIQMVKLVKIGLLAGILLQTVSPEIFPITSDPRMLRVAGMTLFTAGLALAVIARLQLGNQWSDIEIASVSAQHQVVDRGVYGFIRHPIYTGDVLLLTGLELALNSWLVLGVIALVAVVWRKASSEERRLAVQLPAYRDYQERTKRFVPFVI